MRPANRLRYSIILLLIMILAFGTVTYAWITLSTINSIEGLSLTATSGDELQISLDGENYDSNISSEELELLFQHITLTNVTSKDGKVFRKGGLKGDDDTTPNEDYLTFDLWFQTVEPTHTVYLINNVSDEVSYDVSSMGTYVVSQGVQWTSRIEFLNGSSVNDVVEAGTTDTYYGSDTIRLSFQEIKDENNLLDDRDETELNTIIFDPSENPARGFNKSYGAYNYFVLMTNYYISRPDYEPQTLYHLSDPDPTNPYVTYTRDSHVMTLQETDVTDENGKTYYRGKLRVSMWVEGWDADTFDAVNKDHVKAQLQFKLLEYLENSPITD